MNAPGFDVSAVRTPCYVVDRALLEANLRLLRRVAQEAGCKILLAQKAFSMFYFYPLISDYLDGFAASGLYEARLGREAGRGEVHTFSPAFTRGDFDQICSVSDYLVFNSLRQWHDFSAAALGAGMRCGIRINPECSTQAHGIYDPCAPGSRLGMTRAQLGGTLPDGLEGLHFHTLCEQDADALERTMAAVEARFAPHLEKARWLNMGGGHHITRPGYDIERLIRLIRRVQETYGVAVYLEPGEAIALNAGFLVAEVVDIVENGGIRNAVLDASAACHMPDVIEMPYRPPVLHSAPAGERAHTFRLTGPTCLAGDIVGDYAFDVPLVPGSRVVFGDMAIYTMVKNNTFNGMPLPDIYALEGGALRLVRRFGYEDFRNRLS